MQGLRLHLTVNLEQLRQKISVGRCRLLNFAPLHPSFGQGHFLNRLESILKWNPEHRPDHILLLSPRGSDIDDGLIAPRQSLVQDAGNHCQRDQQDEHQRADAEELDDGVISLSKSRL